jgi:hypothetical protein
LSTRAWLAFDGGPPEKVSLRKPGINNHLQIISGARFHVAFLKAYCGFQPNVGMSRLDANTLPGNDKDVLFGAQIEIEGCGKVGQKPGIRSLNGKTRGE